MLHKTNNSKFLKIYQGIKFLWEAAQYSFLELKFEHRRYRLGLSWIIISHLIFLSGIAFIFRPFSEFSTSYWFCYVAIGLTLWNFINGNITSSISFFNKFKGTWDGNPRTLYFLQTTATFRQLILLFMQFTVVFPMIFYFNGFTIQSLVFGILFLLFLTHIAYCVHKILSPLVIIFSDLGPTITVVMRAMFFITPIFWNIENASGFRNLIIQYNPFFHFIQIFRNFFIEGFILSNSLIIAVSIWFALYLISLIMGNKLTKLVLNKF